MTDGSKLWVITVILMHVIRKRFYFAARQKIIIIVGRLLARVLMFNRLRAFWPEGY